MKVISSQILLKQTLVRIMLSLLNSAKVFLWVQGDDLADAEWMCRYSFDTWINMSYQITWTLLRGTGSLFLTKQERNDNTIQVPGTALSQKKPVVLAFS